MSKRTFHRHQPRVKIVWRRCIVPAQIGILQYILGIGARTQHPVSDVEQTRAILIEVTNVLIAVLIH